MCNIYISILFRGRSQYSTWDLETQNFPWETGFGGEIYLTQIVIFSEEEEKKKLNDSSELETLLLDPTPDHIACAFHRAYKDNFMCLPAPTPEEPETKQWYNFSEAQHGRWITKP